ncbi:MAG: VirB6/TrbL-like conjugal transfer protein, CD1112 family [Brotaphodocola sp.]
MGGIIEKITDFIKEMLQGWVLSNLETMFTDVNDKVGTIAGEVSTTPSAWNSGIFSMVQSLSENVIVPIAGMIISFVLVYELITMVIDKNNMHEFDTALFFRFLFKACIAVSLLSQTFDIVMAVFDVGSHVVTQAAGTISGSTSLDVQSTLTAMFNRQLDTTGIGELIGLGIETMIISLCMKIMSVLITVILYGRMIEIYLYVSVAPIPAATVTNREWGSIGTNYLKGLIALAFQGFFIMVCVAIYAVLVSGVTVASNLHTALWSVAAYTIILCFSLFKTGSLSRSIFNAH